VARDLTASTRPRLGWLPNALTLTRLLAIPVLLGILIAADGPTSPVAAWLFGAVAVTDYLDGYLARRLHAESRFGQLADPLVDRLLVAVGLVGLILLDRLHAAGPAVLLARDVLAVAGFALLMRLGRDPRVDFLGKCASALAMAATALAMLSTARWIDVLFWISVVFAVVTLLNYARTAVRPRPSTSTPA
jgi:CDP-diacylglycerol--glycerol-3-phosphate 3-phosphatidyltransferase